MSIDVIPAHTARWRQPLFRLAVLRVRHRRGMGGLNGSANFPPSEVVITAERGQNATYVQGNAGMVVCECDDVLTLQQLVVSCWEF